jgi:hypothetical protein
VVQEGGGHSLRKCRLPPGVLMLFVLSNGNSLAMTLFAGEFPNMDFFLQSEAAADDEDFFDNRNDERVAFFADGKRPVHFPV